MTNALTPPFAECVQPGPARRGGQHAPRPILGSAWSGAILLVKCGRCAVTRDGDCLCQPASRALTLVGPGFGRAVDPPARFCLLSMRVRLPNPADIRTGKSAAGNLVI